MCGSVGGGVGLKIPPGAMNAIMTEPRMKTMSMKQINIISLIDLSKQRAPLGCLRIRAVLQ